VHTKPYCVKYGKHGHEYAKMIGKEMVEKEILYR
jgi:hypothetical protein